MIKNFKWLLLVSLTFVACDNNDEITTVPDSSDGLPLTAGSADFAKYVALGDSFAAGYSDGALFVKGQEGAYPNVLAQQFALVGGGAFTTPLMADNIGGFLFMGNVAASPRLYFNGIGPVPVSGRPTTEITTHLTGTFNNMGIPGAKSFHLATPGYGTLNPYFGRFASSATTTVLADASNQNATFFSLWIGGNDVLTYATSGGVGINRTGNGNPATYGSNDITDPNVFAGTFSALVAGLTAKGAKGVVANLPYVNALPYFTTVPTSPLSPAALGGAVGVAQINGLYSLLRTALGTADAGRISLLSATSASPLLIKDESLVDKSAQMIPVLTGYFTQQGDPNAATNAAIFASIFGQARQAAAGDYVLLTTRSVIGSAVTGAPSTINKFGITYPLQDGHILTADETMQVKVATDAYNLTIKSVADSKGLAFVDTKAIMNQLVNGGISANGFTVTAAFVTGGGFSLDGVHPSPRGYALIANKFIEAVNTTYGSNLKGVDLGNYRILFPSTL
jgi:lysophospholipase L1-like esterase